MTVSLLGSLAGTLLGWLMGFLSLFLILLVLIQRGKGGGLTGALGGPGGQSAFGSKAGDTFTVITVVVASIWGFTCAFTMWLLGTHTPTKLTETTLSAGPGDEAETTGNDLGIPPAGFGGLGIGDGASDTTETPSMDLIPADGGDAAGKTSEPESTEPEPKSSDAEPSDAESTDAEPTSTEPTSSEPASTDAASKSGESSEPDRASTDSPEPAETDSDGGSDNN